MSRILNNAIMEFEDLQALGHAAADYKEIVGLALICKPNEKHLTETVSRLHNAIGNVELTEIGDLFLSLDVHDIITPSKSVLLSVQGLADVIGKKLDIVKKRIDRNASYVLRFCISLCKILGTEIEKMERRIETEPTSDDIGAWNRYELYQNGEYGDMQFAEFVQKCLLTGLQPKEAVRRLNYFIGRCDNKQHKQEFRNLLLHYTSPQAPQSRETPTADQTPTGEAKTRQTQPEYSEKLLELFNNHAELIEQLIGLSDDEIAKKIRLWAGEKDKFGKPKIQNPGNRLKNTFAKELKRAGLIKGVSDNFRKKL